ncbi:MAG: hypothetical protein LUG99_02920 [Lachnospiraceae bacterium]|nr:hypothetical protein [Lachnospiraceae bacterium]
MKFTVNKAKAIISGAVTLFFGGFGLYYLSRALWPETLVFLALAVVFGIQLVRNASTVTIDRQSITFAFLGRSRQSLDWADVKEMGLVGENVLSRNKKKSGDKYIYFSPHEMTADERFQMIVKWPPKDMPYLLYGEKQLEYAQALWGKELKTYNVEELYPNSEEVTGRKSKN